MSGNHHILRSSGVSGSGCTSNCYWSGYIGEPTNGDSIRAAYGYLHPYQCDTTHSSHIKIVAWVGIGGFNSPNLWQAGIENDYSTSYGPYYWYDEFPQTGIVRINTPIGYTCGDALYTYVDYNYTLKGWAFYEIIDRNTGNSVSQTVQFAPSLNSAEWIDERPGCGSDNFALGNFYNDVWSGYYWDVQGNFYSIGGLGSHYYQASMNYAGNSAYPSSLYQVGSHPNAGFYDFFQGTGTTTC